MVHLCFVAVPEGEYVVKRLLAWYHFDALTQLFNLRNENISKRDYRFYPRCGSMCLEVMVVYDS